MNINVLRAKGTFLTAYYSVFEIWCMKCLVLCVGQLLQDGMCVQVWQCDCLDASGQSWAAGSTHQVDCNNCSCADGELSCTNHSCAGENSCAWSSWSTWASCSSTCGPGRRTRFRWHSQAASRMEALSVQDFVNVFFCFFQISGSWGWWCKLPVWRSPAQTMWPRPVPPTVCPWPAGTVCRRHLVRRGM